MSQDILNRIKAARGTSEPSSEEPTEQAEAVELSTDLVDEPAPEEEIVSESVEEQAEPVHEEEEVNDLLYYELDGEEVTSEQLKEWKNNGLMQADYTRKTQELADSRKAFEDEFNSFNAEKAQFNEKLAQLNAMIETEQLSDEEVAEMREYEPEKYINYMEKQQKRKEFLKENKPATAKTKVNVQEEQQKLIAANPQWLKDGKPTKAYETDMGALTKYYHDNGFTQDIVDMVNSNAALAQMAINAARYGESSSKNAAIEKRVRKAPVATKPKQQPVNAGIDKQIADLKEKVRKTGDPKLFQQLRALERKKSA